MCKHKMMMIRTPSLSSGWLFRFRFWYEIHYRNTSVRVTMIDNDFESPPHIRKSRKLFWIFCLIRGKEVQIRPYQLSRSFLSRFYYIPVYAMLSFPPTTAFNETFHNNFSWGFNDSHGVSSFCLHLIEKTFTEYLVTLNRVEVDYDCELNWFY